MAGMLPRPFDFDPADTELAMATERSARRKRRYITLVILVVALFGGWSALWYYASGRAQETLEGWRAREAKSGRVYDCGSQDIGGYPFRIEVNCERASALVQMAPPFEVKLASILAAVQIYQPDLVISEFTGPATIADPGQPPTFVANWSLGQSSLRGTPAAPERLAVVFDDPVVERVTGTNREALLRAKHIEIHGRVAEGSAANKPVIEAALKVDAASAPFIHPAMVQPVDADITALMHGLNDFSPKPWPVRFREIQAAGGRIDITKARVQQGEIIATGSGSLALNTNGRLEGQMRLVVAGVDEFLEKIGAQRLVQNSPTVDRLAGALDRLAPGLGNVARQQAGANISAGINLLGEPTTLEGRRAVSLPLRFNDGAVFLGPIPIGNTPALF